MNNPTKQALTLDDLRGLRGQILAIVARNKAEDVRVFGSVARGEATPESDVDFLVTFQPGASLYDLSGLVLDLKELLGCDVNVVSDHPGLRERFRRRIMRDAVPL
ncbi:MAG: nucleotidyltransferase [Anaerolineaceae bacterium]|nr:MAG: nucleotidyltransferase [Anaerolineaceae bacterium]